MCRRYHRQRVSKNTIRDPLPETTPACKPTGLVTTPKPLPNFMINSITVFVSDPTNVSGFLKEALHFTLPKVTTPLTGYPPVMDNTKRYWFNNENILLDPDNNPVNPVLDIITTGNQTTTKPRKTTIITTGCCGCSSCKSTPTTSLTPTNISTDNDCEFKVGAHFALSLVSNHDNGLFTTKDIPFLLNIVKYGIYYDMTIPGCEWSTSTPPPECRACAVSPSCEDPKCVDGYPSPTCVDTNINYIYYYEKRTDHVFQLYFGIADSLIYTVMELNFPYQDMTQGENRSFSYEFVNQLKLLNKCSACKNNPTPLPCIHLNDSKCLCALDPAGKKYASHTVGYCPPGSLDCRLPTPAPTPTSSDQTDDPIKLIFYQHLGFGTTQLASRDRLPPDVLDKWYSFTRLWNFQSMRGPFHPYYIDCNEYKDHNPLCQAGLCFNLKCSDTDTTDVPIWVFSNLNGNDTDPLPKLSSLQANFYSSGSHMLYLEADQDQGYNYPDKFVAKGTPQPPRMTPPGIICSGSTKGRCADVDWINQKCVVESPQGAFGVDGICKSSLDSPIPTPVLYTPPPPGSAWKDWGSYSMYSNPKPVTSLPLYDLMPFEASIRQIQTWQDLCFTYFGDNISVEFSVVHETLLNIIQMGKNTPRANSVIVMYNDSHLYPEYVTSMYSTATLTKVTRRPTYINNISTDTSKYGMVLHTTPDIATSTNLRQYGPIAGQGLFLFVMYIYC